MIERRLEELRVEWPESPDVVPAVIEGIARRAERRPGRLAPALALGLAVVLAVVVVIPAAREQVASWLGLRGVTIVQVSDPSLDPGEGLAIEELGEEVAVADLDRLAGFPPLLPSELGPPGRAFVDRAGRVWMIYGPGDGLPMMSTVEAGAIVTQFVTADAPGLTKGLFATSPESVATDVNGWLALWVPGPHELLLPELAATAVDGRSVGNTLIWETDRLTIRMETGLDLQAALALARTFE